jgi:hypothetical protein
MAVEAQKSMVSVLRKTLERQAVVARVKFKLNPNQVEQILMSYINNRNTPPYNELLKVLKDYPLSDENIKVLFEDSLACVVHLGGKMKQYVEVVCSIDWANHSEESVALYSKFVLSLVTAHTYHCPMVLRILMKKFKGNFSKK